MTLLLEVKFGSQVYGTNTPESDIDIGRVLLEPKEFIFGIQNLDVKSNTIAQTVKGEIDTREMYLRRFIKLCAQGNPNVIEWLYTPANHIDHMHPLFREVFWHNRNILLNKKKLVDSHMGFAYSQIIKMRKHEDSMGAKRKALCAKHGYDTKYASHAMRLMFQLQDIMCWGEIILPYTDSIVKILRDIKAGELSLADFDHMYDKVKDVTQKFIDEEDTMSSKTDYKRVAHFLEYFYQKIYYDK